MDQGISALIVAGIGIGGVVITSWVGYRGARHAASAQVDAALQGVQAQARVELEASRRQARSEAYAGFLGEIDAARMAIDRAHQVGYNAVIAIQVERHGYDIAPPLPSDAGSIRSTMEERVEALWLRPSVLRMLGDAQLADDAEALVRLAREAVDQFVFVDLAEADGPRSMEPVYERIRTKLDSLSVGIRSWAESAVSSLERSWQE
ncbi:hypothetical protein ACFVW5_04910 [Streptomyces sp. NPDC058232]|uniref:hypothetical protein n=1 Tax=Streptomyces sp. NPDC058232 TaxID=3346393 RepID=UPI0036E71A6E